MTLILLFIILSRLNEINSINKRKLKDFVMKNLILFSGLSMFFLLLNTTISQHFEFIILHNNDMHARFEKQKRFGGFARTAHYINKLRKQANEGTLPPVLFMNAGDTFTGTVWFSIHRWKIAAAFVRALKPDIISLGNHEFDDGVLSMKQFAQEVGCPVVCANCNFKQEPEAQGIIKPSYVLTVNGRKIGVVGYLTTETSDASSSGQTIFEEEVEAVRKEAQRLLADGVNIIIALGHAGFEVDKQIAKEVEEVDVVVGGHTNTFLWHGDLKAIPSKEKPEGFYPTLIYRDKDVPPCPVVQAYAYTKYIGQLRLTFNEEGQLIDSKGNNSFVVCLDESFSEDPEILKLLESFRPDVNKVQTRVVGNTQVDLSTTTCLNSECNIGNMIADAFVDYKTSVYNGSRGWTDCPIALLNGGAIRSSIKSGPITMANLYTAMPFFQKLMSFDISGRQIKKTLELGVRAEIFKAAGEFVQVSGIHYTVNRHKPVNQRISNIKVRCSNCKYPTYKPIILGKFYRVITVTFMALGGDGHVALSKKRNTIIENVYDTEVVERYLKYNTYVRPEIEERISYPRVMLRSTINAGNEIKLAWTMTFCNILYLI